MIQAIETKYFGPTNSRGSRIKATSASGHSVTVGYSSELSVEQNHKAAAKALCEKLGWYGTYAGGSTKGGYVFVQAIDAADCFRVERPVDGEIPF
jgi:hypothetical protein